MAWRDATQRVITQSKVIIIRGESTFENLHIQMYLMHYEMFYDLSFMSNFNINTVINITI